MILEYIRVNIVKGGLLNIMKKSNALRIIGIITAIISIANGLYVYFSNGINVERLQTVINGNSAAKFAAQQALDTLNLFITLSIVGAVLGLIVGILSTIQVNKALCVISTVIFTLFTLAVSIICIINQFFIGIIVVFIMALIMMILSIKAEKN